MTTGFQRSVTSHVMIAQILCEERTLLYVAPHIFHCKSRVLIIDYGLDKIRLDLTCSSSCGLRTLFHNKDY